MESNLIHDFCISVGSFVGILAKMYALRCDSTVWSRKSSLPNLVFYPPSVWAFFDLGLLVTGFSTFTSFLIWVGIYWFRSPEGEDWLGRVDRTYCEWVCDVVF